MQAIGTGDAAPDILLQRSGPKLGSRVYTLALAARSRAHRATTSGKRYYTSAMLAALPAATSSNGGEGEIGVLPTTQEAGREV